MSNWLCESPSPVDEVSGDGFDLKIITVLYHSFIQQPTVEQTKLKLSQHVMCRPSRSCNHLQSTTVIISRSLGDFTDRSSTRTRLSGAASAERRTL
jgi:hypothetical protein